MTARVFRSWAAVVPTLILASSFLAACGGGGGGTTAGVAGGTVRVSVAGETVGAAAPATGIFAAGLAAPAGTDNVDHVWITVTKVALLPGASGGPDPNGEPVVEGDGAGGGFVAASVVPPQEIDLLNLPQAPFAWFLDAIESVPAGEYGKIRLYYRDPKVHFEGAPDNAIVHGTANFHLDIHFKGGGLVIPVRTNAGGGVVIHDVVITFVLGKDGLKLTVNNNNILMRPQVFASAGPVQMGISGIADNVDKAQRSFDIATADGRSFHAVYDDGTSWAFRDPSRSVSVSAALGVAALRDTAFVDVFGNFSGTPLVIFADDILITFPAERSGVVDNGWRADNTFVLRPPSDNVVFPQPDRFTAYYDNAVFPHAPLTQAAIDNNVEVLARGYAVGDIGIEAFWISIGP